MRPDLKSRNATRLMFHLETRLPPKTISRIKHASSPDNEGDCLFLDSYNRHTAWAWVYGVGSPERNRDKLTPMDFFFTRNGERLSKHTPGIKTLVEILSPIEGQMEFLCQVDFQPTKRAKPKSVLKLPLKLADAEDVPFNTIMGVHLARRDGKEVKYEAFLDVTPGGTLRTSIVFTRKLTLDDSVADRVLDEASAISQQLISTEERHT